MGLSVHQEDAWACELISRLSALVETRVPAIQEVDLGSRVHCAIEDFLGQERSIRIGDLLRDPSERERRLDFIVLLVNRPLGRTLLPDDDFEIHAGDRLLLCGRYAAMDRFRWTLCHEATLEYVVTGRTRPRGWVWRRLSRSWSGEKG
jgi:hypothetical protein